ncbi:MAG: ATP-binding protein [Bacteroidota bacterium]
MFKLNRKKNRNSEVEAGEHSPEDSPRELAIDSQTGGTNGHVVHNHLPPLFTALNYLQSFLLARLKHYFNEEQHEPFVPLQLPELGSGDSTAFSRFLHQRQPNQQQLLVLLTALAPHIYPNFFDAILARFVPKGGELPEFGGVKGTNHRGLLPTGDTVAFILAGNDMQQRLDLQALFRQHSFFNSERIVWLEDPKPGEPFLSGRLMMDDELAEVFITERVSIPKQSMNFPAQYISTELEWDDLVLDPETLLRIHELEHWLQHNQTLLYDWGMYKKIKPGYRVLFHGPPGTGKTLTASLLGKYSNRSVFRIDLSMIVSKYIGETEKNLAKLFDKAEHKNWILFFDEADSIFGKRTNVRDAHDKYANQEVSYLLQRIESYNGLVILASNYKNNIDDAFTRRFQSIVYFPKPKAPQRLLLWQKSFPEQLQFASSIDWAHISKQYELTGSNIINIVQYCCNEVLAKGQTELSLEDLLLGIRREYAKEDKVF